MTFDSLILSLPTRNSTMRMRVWRALKETGCGVLRDGLYVLPSGAAGSAALAGLETEIRAAGGFAMIVELNVRTADQLAEVRKLFDRSAGYGALVQKINADVRKVLAHKDLQERMIAAGFDPADTTVEQFEAYVKRDVALYDRIVRESKMKLD